MRRGLGMGLTAALAALVRLPTELVVSVHKAAQRWGARLTRLTGGETVQARAGSAKRNGKGKRGKYKGRLHARQGSRRRGSGRTARRFKDKAKRHA